MTAASRDRPFLLVIVCLVFIRGHSTLPMTSQLTGTDPVKPLMPRGFLTDVFVFPTEDYNQYEDTSTPITPNRAATHGGIFQRCAYSPCLENQISCTELAASTGCLCPGFTLHNQLPEAPDLKSVTWNGSEVIIQWCAPNSYVTSYTVTVGGEERQTFGKNQRSGALGDIDHITEVCVVAVNDSGVSGASCMMHHPRDDSLPLKAGLIGGALGLLLCLLLGVLLWRHRRQRKQASISMYDTDEPE